MPKLVDSLSVVAFDLDGTMLDTAPDLGAAANMMLAILGGKPVPEQRVRALIGGGVEEFVAGVLRESLGGAAPRAALHAAAVSLFADLYGQRLYDRSRLYPGVLRALHMLYTAGVKVCCITNKSSRFTLPLLAAARIGHLFALTLCADRVEDRKPSPSMLLSACARLDVEPERMLYVGDSSCDVVAGHRAGCRVVAVDYGYRRDLPPAAFGANWTVGNLLEIFALRVPVETGVLALRASV